MARKFSESKGKNWRDGGWNIVSRAAKSSFKIPDVYHWGLGIGGLATLAILSFPMVLLRAENCRACKILLFILMDRDSGDLWFRKRSS